MPSTRTQVYFTREQRRRLDAVAEREGKTLAGVVREAVDAWIGDARPDVDLVLEETFGSAPDLEYPAREDWDRGYG